jgi:Zn finger protein HypA/HybF involved in hydrogenase expression
MHELGIAVSVLDMLRREVEARPGAQLREATLRVGEFSGVDIESLRFCLETAAQETRLAGARFQMERADDDALELVRMELEIP